MEQLDTRNRTKNVLIIVFLIITLGLLIGNYFFIKNYYSNQDKNNKYQNKLQELKQIEQILTKEINEIQDNINFLNNIDTEVVNAKNKYYETLKRFEDKVSNGEVNYKIAYLTFDDGPYNLTRSFLKILEDNDVRATFFTIGLDKETCYDDRSKSCSHVYQEIAKRGHTMANHTYSHLIRAGLYSSADSFIHQVKLQEDLIRNKTGITTNIVRFPGGSAQAGYLKDGIVGKLRENGYGWVDWTSLNGDGGAVLNAAVAFENFKNTINESIEVVLFHDYSYATLAMLPDAIKYLKDNNYVLLPLFYQSKMVNK